MQIKLIKASEIMSIIPLVSELNPNLSVELLSKRLNDMLKEGYECIGCYESDKLVGICGLWMQTRFYSGKVIEPDNVYVKQEYRDSGLGQKIMDFVYELADKRACDVVELNCYVDNDGGNRFWKRQGFKILGHHYLKKIDSKKLN
jgi:ribosomal protein S18 acetylase RimI-like enzyme